MVYTGRNPRPVYHCDNPNLLLGQKRCITFCGFRADKLISDGVLEAVAPFVIDAAIEARAMVSQAVEADRRGVLQRKSRQDVTLIDAACSRTDVGSFQRVALMRERYVCSQAAT